MSAAARFIDLWMSPDYPPRPITQARLEAAELQLGVRLPDDYRIEVLRFGLLSPTIDLLNTIVDREIDMPDLSDMLAPEDVVEITRAWRTMGLPTHLFAFATDCGGNLFCFGDDGNEAVFFFDHDFGDVREIAQSFTRWIHAFCDLCD